MSDDKIISFPGKTELPDCTLTIERASFSMCNHDRITLDEHRRVIRCTGCEKVFDPFSYMLSNASTITRAWADYRSMQQRLSEKQDSIEALAKEERRLKARVKTLKDKAEPGIDIKGKYL